ncbi:Kinase family protein [Quillaja saponaria]|uniref:Kinase family protein n=1 Tax=Quillaja saponaria TaxID=32244 RepID=A0AAD7VJW2_QUISA|nr:Kinase family protein [Quillaja saponaria]
MVADFGLARWQVDGQLAEETLVIGAIGSIAPEYIQTGLITEKADVYAFGVVLLEVLSGFKATEFSRITGQPSVPEWGCILLDKKMTDKIVDSQLENNYVEKEVEFMMYAAFLCTLPHPDQRPRMSKVLKILEGDFLIDMDSTYSALNIYNSCLSVRQTKSRLGHIPSHLKEPKDYMKQRHFGMSLHETSGRNSPSKAVRISNQSEKISIPWESEDDVSQEYQTYLQGSLAKFVQHLNGN